MTTLSKIATNEGTYIITCTFKDSAGAAVTPNVPLTWDLADIAGKVVNSRSGEVITPDTSVNIVLGALDLDNADGGERVFTIKGTYDSLSYGNGLPIRAQANFSIGSWVE